MSKRKKVIGIISFVIIVAVIVLTAPLIYEYHCQNRVYSDLEERLSEDILSANIRIMMKVTTVKDNSEGMSFGEIGSGVIFDSDEEYCYVLTAAHVVDSDSEVDTMVEFDGNAKESRSYCIIPADAPTLQEAQKEARDSDKKHLDHEEYWSWYPEAEIEYVSEEQDIAILKFQSSDEFKTLTFAEADPAYGNRVIAIGKGDMGQEIHYGKITSKDLKNFSTKDGRTDETLYTNAYETHGFSGGAILNEDMKVAGMTVGGGTDVFGHFKYGAMIPISTIEKEIAVWKMQL